MPAMQTTAVHMLSARFVAEAISSRVANLRKHAELVRREDIEGIHDMRVASRRLRAALSEMRAFLAKEQRKQLQAHVRQVTRLLGRPRELDVSIKTLEQMHRDNGSDNAGLLYGLDQLRQERAALSPSCAEAVALVESLELDTTLIALLDPERVKERNLLEVGPRRLKRQLRALTEEYLKWRRGGERSQLHLVRIAFKKFRYVCEVFTPLYGDRMKPLIGDLKRVQEHLGDWNDARVIAEEFTRLRETASEQVRAEMERVIAASEEKSTALLEAFQKTADQFFSPENRRTLRLMFREAQLRDNS